MRGPARRRPVRYFVCGKTLGFSTLCAALTLILAFFTFLTTFLAFFVTGLQTPPLTTTCWMTTFSIVTVFVTGGPGVSGVVTQLPELSLVMPAGMLVWTPSMFGQTSVGGVTQLPALSLVMPAG